MDCTGCGAYYLIPGRSYPSLPAGEYTLIVTEYHDSVRLPDAQEVTVTFTVAPALGAEPTSWGRIRSLFAYMGEKPRSAK